jgi:RHS repeat-associated protein
MKIIAKRDTCLKVITAWIVVVAMILAPALCDRGVMAILMRANAEAQSLSTTTYTYDNNGNMLSRTTGTQTDIYTYDAENRLINANVQGGANPGVVTYAYDADGMRTGKTMAGLPSTFLIDKNRSYAQVVTETTGGTTVTYDHGHQLISQTRTGGGTRFYISDGQLSTRQLTTPAGAVTDTYVYDAFGATLASTGATPNVYLYTGEQLDPNVGFYYLRDRYYDQATGRFITTDPFQGNIFEPLSLHRYLYANANPVNYIDPSGENPILLVIAGIVGLVVLITTLAAQNSLSSNANSLLSDYRIRTDQFRIKFCTGGSAVLGVGGGGFSAVIAEKLSAEDLKRGLQPESAAYFVSVTGIGFDQGISFPGGEITFPTEFRKNVKSFQGYGEMINAGASITIAGSSWENQVLPDGTKISNSSLIQGGINNAKPNPKKAGVGWRYAQTFWTIATRNQSLDKTGNLQCPKT